MTRPMKPLVKSGGYYPSNRWTPLVYRGGYTTANGGGEQPDPVEKTASGAIVHITDALAAPVSALSVAIEPVQNLHGYDNPWPAGGGKNLLTALPSPGTTVWFCEPNGFTFKANQTYCFSIGNAITVGSYAIYAADKKTQLAYANSNRKVTYTPTVDTVGYPRLYAGEGVSQEAINSAQLELGNSRTTYAPYSNICPISGWTGAEVTRTGVNLLPPMSADKTISGVTWHVNEDNSISVSGTASRNSIVDFGRGYLTLKPGTYTTNRAKDGVVCAIWEDSSPAQLIDGTGGTFTLTHDTSIFIRFFVASGGTVNTTIYPQLKFGSTATTYAPYTGDTLSVTFPSSAGTVYGGTLDVTTGKLTVDRAMFAPTELKGGTYLASNVHYPWVDVPLPATAYSDGLCNKLRCVTSYGGFTADISFMVRDSFIAMNLSGAGYSTRDDAVAAGAAFIQAGDVQFCYELATPIAYDLTPTEVKTLLGENNIWADTGDVTVTYLADGNASDAEALGILLGGRYTPSDDVTDKEALGIILGGTE